MSGDYIVKLQTNDTNLNKSVPIVSDPGGMENTLQLPTNFNIRYQVGKCVKHVIEPYGTVNNQLQNIIFQVSDLGKELKNIPDISSSDNDFVTEEDFWKKCNQNKHGITDMRYITITNDEEADVYVTNISQSVKSHFNRFNLLNLLKTWTDRLMWDQYEGFNSNIWSMMSANESLFIIENDTLTLFYKNYGENIRVNIDNNVLEKDLTKPHPLKDGCIIKVEVRRHVNEWKELFTCKYCFLHYPVNDKKTLSFFYKRFHDSEAELEKVRRSLETQLQICKDLSSKFEKKKKAWQTREKELESHLKQFQGNSPREIKLRMRARGEKIEELLCA